MSPVVPTSAPVVVSAIAGVLPGRDERGLRRAVPAVVVSAIAGVLPGVPTAVAAGEGASMAASCGKAEVGHAHAAVVAAEHVTGLEDRGG